MSEAPAAAAGAGGLPRPSPGPVAVSALGPALLAALAAAALLCGARAARAQEQDTAAAGRADTASAAAAGDAAGDTSSVYRREVFRYPATGRRDPFRVLTRAAVSEPALDRLRLTGILYTEGNGESVAVLTDPESGRRYRLRQGNRVGAARLVAIGPDSVTFRVRSSEQQPTERVLRLRKREESEPR